MIHVLRFIFCVIVGLVLMALFFAGNALYEYNRGPIPNATELEKLERMDAACESIGGVPGKDVYVDGLVSRCWVPR